MKSTLKFFAIALITLVIACSEKKVEPTSNLSTNPADCKLTNITFSDGSTPFNYSNNADGTVSQITNGSTVNTFTYTNGQLTNQKNAQLEMKYSYTGSDLSNIELFDGAGAKIGDLVVALTASKQISTLTVTNTGTAFASFNGVVTTFTYDASGNNTLIEVKSGTNLIAKTEYGNFVNVRSHLATLKGLILNTNTTPLGIFEQAPILKYPNSSPNSYKRFTTLDANSQPTATMSVVDDFIYERIANESGVQKERKTIGGGSTFYEYTGCK